MHPIKGMILGHSMQNRSFFDVLTAAAIAMVITALASISLETPQQAYALQIVSQKNQAGSNTQTGLINVGKHKSMLEQECPRTICELLNSDTSYPNFLKLLCKSCG